VQQQWYQPGYDWTYQPQWQAMEPQVFYPNPPLLVPVVPTRQRGLQQQVPRKQQVETIATSWIPVERQAERHQTPVRYQHEGGQQAPLRQQRSCYEEEVVEEQVTSNLQYQSPRTKSVTLNY